MNPQIHHVLSQKRWPEVGPGDFDDCWVLAALQAVHAVAPWLRLPSAREFRAHTNVAPNVLGSDQAGNAKDMGKGIRGAFPGLKIRVIDEVDQMSFATFAGEVRRGRVAALIVNSANLPAGQQFGFDGIHAVTVAVVNGKWHVMNPLARPHAEPVVMAQEDVRKASKGFARVVHAVLMPMLQEALVTHELHAAQVKKLEDRIRALGG